MQKISTSKAKKTAIAIRSIVFSFVAGMLLITTTTTLLGNTGPHIIGNAYAQTPSTNTNATTSAATAVGRNATAAMNITATSTLGKLIYEEHGNVTVERVLSVTDTSATIESIYTARGVFNGTTSVTDIGTVVYSVNNIGQFPGKGQGLLRTSDGSMAAYTLRSTGSLDIHGNSNIQGTMHFTLLSTGKLVNLHDANLIFKAQIKPKGDFILRAWEQK